MSYSADMVSILVTRKEDDMRLICRTNRYCRGSSLWLAVACASVLWASSASHAARDWQKEINAARSGKWNANRTQSMRMAVEKIMAIAAAEDAPEETRRLAMHNVCQILLDIVSATQDPADARKVLELCEKSDALPENRAWTLNFTANRVDAYLALLSLKQADVLLEALAAVDKMEALYKANPTYRRHPMIAQSKRAQAYAYAGDFTKAAEAFDAFFAQEGTKCSSQLYVDAVTAYKAAGQDEKARKAIMQGMQKCSGASGYQLVEKCFITTVGGLAFDDTTVGQILAGAACNDDVLNTVLQRASKDRSLEGDVDGALAYAKLAFDVAPVEALQPATEWLTRCLRAKHMDVETANAFLACLNGTAGPDMKNPLADVKSPLADAVRDELRLARDAVCPCAGNVYQDLKTHGTLSLLLGECDAALASYAAAYRAASIDQVRQASGLVPRALKMRDGSLKPANLYLEYQKHGPAGTDGRPGTPDDIANPLPANLPPLPENIRKGLNQVAASNGEALMDIDVRSSACLALGDCRKGLALAKAAYAVAGMDNASQVKVVKMMASVIKAHDGHVVRANEYLAFQSRGAKDAPAAAKNPLQDIMKEIGQ